MKLCGRFLPLKTAELWDLSQKVSSEMMNFQTTISEYNFESSLVRNFVTINKCLSLLKCSACANEQCENRIPISPEENFQTICHTCKIQKPHNEESRSLSVAEIISRISFINLLHVVIYLVTRLPQWRLPARF